MTIRTQIAILSLCLCSIGMRAETKWVDVTNNYLKNPQFNTSDRSDWEAHMDILSSGATSWSR